MHQYFFRNQAINDLWLVIVIDLKELKNGIFQFKNRSV